MAPAPQLPDDTAEQLQQTAAGLASYIVLFVKQAGASSEAATDRDGFLSWKAESHAVAGGISAGYMATAFGNARLLGLVYAAAVYGQSHEHSGQRARIIADIIREFHYAVIGIPIGAILGVATRAGAAAYGVDVPTLPQGPPLPGAPA